MRWQNKIPQRVAEQIANLGWEVPEEQIHELGQAIAQELILDYNDLLRMRVEQDQVERREALARMRNEFGPDLTPVLNAIERALKAMPDGLGEELVGARTRDGKRLINRPGLGIWLAQSAIQSGDYIDGEVIDESE